MTSKKHIVARIILDVLSVASGAAVGKVAYVDGLGILGAFVLGIGTFLTVNAVGAAILGYFLAMSFWDNDDS